MTVTLASFHPVSRAVLTALAAVALLATLVVAPVSADAATHYDNPTVPARSSTERSMIKAVLAELNDERADNGLAPLRLNSKLQLSARRHDVIMARHNTLSHKLNDEPRFSARMTRAGYRWDAAGENCAYTSDATTDGVVALEQMMYDEQPPNDGHRQNILGTQYADVGIDVLVDSAHNRTWLTEDFGHPAG